MLEKLVKEAARPEMNRLYRRTCRWWAEIEVLIVTGATTGKVEANNTAIKHIKRTARAYRNPENYSSVILLRCAARTSGMAIHRDGTFTTNREGRQSRIIPAGATWYRHNSKG